MRNILIGLLFVLGIGAIIWFYALRDSATDSVSRGAVVGSATFACSNGRTIAASFYAGADQQVQSEPGQPPVPTGSVDLVLSDGRSVTLPQTLSADGGRYANNDESFVFWTRGNGAFATENGSDSYTGCIRLAADPGGLPEEYANAAKGFSIRLPSVSTASSSATAFTIDDSYTYQAMGPGKGIRGVKFTIPGSVAEGTNLSRDTYLSVETIPGAVSCSAGVFTDASTTVSAVTDGGTEYSFASSTDAAAGNRYEEHVFAIPGTDPCIAVRYLVHYAAIENFPDGAVDEFDRTALLATFDAIRKTLVIGQ